MFGSVLLPPPITRCTSSNSTLSSALFASTIFTSPPSISLAWRPCPAFFTSGDTSNVTFGSSTATGFRYSPASSHCSSRCAARLEALLPCPGRREIYLREIVCEYCTYSNLCNPSELSLRTLKRYRSLCPRTRQCLQPEGIVKVYGKCYCVNSLPGTAHGHCRVAAVQRPPYPPPPAAATTPITGSAAALLVKHAPIFAPLRGIQDRR